MDYHAKLPYPYQKSFPHKLYDLLLQIPPEIGGWLPEGQSFRIMDQKAFAAHVLPRFFAHDKMSSFKRQLNIYGFRCCTKGDKIGAYSHPYFVLGQPQWIDHIEVRRQRPNFCLCTHQSHRFLRSFSRFETVRSLHLYARFGAAACARACARRVACSDQVAVAGARRIRVDSGSRWQGCER